jgi:hypothetical protein
LLGEQALWYLLEIPPLAFSSVFRHKSRKAFPFNSIRPPWALLDLRVSIGRPNVAKKLYVGNLSYTTSDSALRSLFEEYGSVESAQVIMDRDSGRSKGFGFVEMSDNQEAQAAIDGLNGKEVDGRALTVNEARPRENRGGGGRSGGGRGGYGGGGRRY